MCIRGAIAALGALKSGSAELLAQRLLKIGITACVFGVVDLILYFAVLRRDELLVSLGVSECTGVLAIVAALSIRRRWEKQTTKVLNVLSSFAFVGKAVWAVVAFAFVVDDVVKLNRAHVLIGSLKTDLIVVCAWKALKILTSVVFAYFSVQVTRMVFEQIDYLHSYSPINEDAAPVHGGSAPPLLPTAAAGGSGGGSGQHQPHYGATGSYHSQPPVYDPYRQQQPQPQPQPQPQQPQRHTQQQQQQQPMPPAYDYEQQKQQHPSQAQPQFTSTSHPQPPPAQPQPPV